MTSSDMQAEPVPAGLDPMRVLLNRWKADLNATYQTWFLWEDRLKNFRSIRRGIAQVIAEVEEGTFGNTYKGSSLETVVGSIAEQRQIFKGADHAFLWKPKLRIPVWVAANDRGRAYAGGRLGEGCLETLPEAFAGGPAGDAVRLIDVLWLTPDTARVAAAFEVEHTTSIYSGVVRMLDLALGASAESARGLFLVAPDDREGEVRAQLARPAFSRIGDLQVRFLPYSELEKHRHSMARFGQGMKAVEAVARALS